MSAHPNTMYRLTAKAIITNTDGAVLLLRESGGTWGLPGGGVEHGEHILDALSRELQEEIGITRVISATLRHAYPFYSHGQQDWWLWLLYNVDVDMPERFTGDLAQQVEFVHIKDFKGSTNRDEQLLYQALIEQR